MKLKKIFNFKNLFHHTDLAFLGALFALTAFGLIMLSSASSDLGKIRFNDTFYYLQHQFTLGIGLGIIGFLAGYFINYKFWQKIAVPILLFGLLLLVLVFTPLGSYYYGSTRWLQFGPIPLQPAEIMKLCFAIYLASWLSSKKKGTRQTSFMEGYLPFLCLCGVVAGLIFAQPATTIIIIILGAGLAQYFISGAKKSFIVGAILIGILGISIITIITPYRLERITSYVQHVFVKDNLSEAEKIAFTRDEGYQLNQALIAIGNGGLTGIGFGNSTSKYRSLPEPIGDSIFAVIAEELGFLGVSLLLALYALLFVKGFLIATHCRDQFGKIMVTGFVAVFAVQAFINIAAISGIMPLTGVPLPFISYGGTNLAIFLTMGGIIANVSKNS